MSAFDPKRTFKDELYLNAKSCSFHPLAMDFEIPHSHRNNSHGNKPTYLPPCHRTLFLIHPVEIALRSTRGRQLRTLSRQSLKSSFESSALVHSKQEVGRRRVLSLEWRREAATSHARFPLVEVLSGTVLSVGGRHGIYCQPGRTRGKGVFVMG